MSRMERVKEALASTLTKLREQIETSHKTGKIPADYSLGFTNALIFTDHHINMRDGEPKFYERTTSIGTLPKPVALNSGNALKDEHTYQFLQDAVMLRCRVLLGCLQVDHEKKTVDFDDSAGPAIVQLSQAVNEMDQFVSKMMEAMNVEKAAESEPEIECIQGNAGESPEELYSPDGPNERHSESAISGS